MPILNVLILKEITMPKSPFLKKNKPNKKMTDANRRKQKFAIIDYYKKKNTSSKASKSGK